jgi:hypothetical protein
MSDIQKSFHTSARSNIEPSSDAGPKSREPKHEVEPQSDQSPHLKHKDPKKPDSGKGNAASEPHLPSQQGGQKRGYATRPPGGYSKTFKPEGGDKHVCLFLPRFGGEALMDRTLLPRHSLLPSIPLTLPRRLPRRTHQLNLLTRPNILRQAQIPLIMS